MSTLTSPGCSANWSFCDLCFSSLSRRFYVLSCFISSQGSDYFSPFDWIFSDPRLPRIFRLFLGFWHVPDFLRFIFLAFSLLFTLEVVLFSYYTSLSFPPLSFSTMFLLDVPEYGTFSDLFVEFFVSDHVFLFYRSLFPCVERYTCCFPLQCSVPPLWVHPFILSLVPTT